MIEGSRFDLIEKKIQSLRERIDRIGSILLMLIEEGEIPERDRDFLKGLETTEPEEIY